MQVFAGKEGDDVVAGAMAYLSERGVCGVYGVSVVPGRRRKGYAEQLTWRCVLARPHVPASLQPSDSAHPLYKKMGFEGRGRIRGVAAPPHPALSHGMGEGSVPAAPAARDGSTVLRRVDGLWPRASPDAQGDAVSIPCYGASASETQPAERKRRILPRAWACAAAGQGLTAEALADTGRFAQIGRHSLRF